MAPWPVVDRVVEVIADRGDDPSGRYSYGSGFVVAGSTVLTSAHVVAGAKDVWLRRVDKTELKARLDPAFVGDPAGEKAPDLALVSITDESWPGAPGVGLGRVERNHPSGGPVAGRSVGYPWFAEQERHGMVRDLVDVSGQIPLLSHAAVGGLLGLEVTVEPPARPGGDPNKTQWSGMSGAPVFAAGRLVGVVAEHARRAGDSSILAAPLTALEADPQHPLWGPGVAEPSRWWQRLGAAGGSASLVGVPAPREAPYWATIRQNVRVLQARMPRLLSRTDDLERIAEFAGGTEGYRWLTGGAYAGKSALLYMAVTVGALENTKVVAYFLSRRAGDADASRFLEATVPQLELFFDEPAKGLPTRDRFNQLWQRAEQEAKADGHHLLLVVDGLDEDLHPPGQPFVVSFLPVVSSRYGHVLVSSRPYPDLQGKLDPGHPLAACQPVPVEPFRGAANLAAQAEAEIDTLINDDADDHLALDVLGLLTAAGGPLAVHDLASLRADQDPPPPAVKLNVRRLVAERAARSLEPVGSADEPRYQFAHVRLLEHARAKEELTDPSYRDRIHAFAGRWRDRGWPPPNPAQAGTPRYLLDTYPATLAGDPEYPGLFPADPGRLAALAGDLDWATTALQVVGVNRVLATLASAAALAPSDASVAGLAATVGAAARHLSGPSPVSQPADVMRQLCLHATEYRIENLAAQLRGRLAHQLDPDPVPVWTARVTPVPAVVLGAQEGPVVGLGVLADGRVVSGGDDGRLLLWDPHQPDLSFQFGAHEGAVGGLAVLADGRVVSGGDEDGRVLLWDPRQRGQPFQLGGHKGGVSALGVLPDRRVITGGNEGQLLLWNLRNPGQPLELGSHDGAVSAVGVLADGRVVSFGSEGLVLLWNPHKLRQPVQLGTHESDDGAVGVLADGRVVSGGLDGRLLLWNPRQPRQPVELGSHEGGVMRVGVLADGRVVSGGLDGRLLLWNPYQPGQPVELGAHDYMVRAIGVLADGQVVSGGEEGRVLLWRPRQPDQFLQFSAYDIGVGAVVVLPDGRVVSGAVDGRLLLWDPPKSSQPLELGVHDGGVESLAVLADGRVVSGGVDGQVLLWNPREPGKPLQLGAHEYGVKAVGVLADGRVVSGAVDGRVLLWDSRKPRQPLELGVHDGLVKAVGVLPDGRVVSGGENDVRVLLWDPSKPRQPLELGVHDGGVEAVGVLPDGRVVTGGWEGRVLVWDPGKPGEPLELGRHDGAVVAVGVLADGRVVTGAWEGERLRVWDLRRPLQPVAEVGTPVTALHVGPVGKSGNQQLLVAEPLSLWDISLGHDQR
jgi:WD40 repeat protein